jgi:hypothetical protein
MTISRKVVRTIVVLYPRGRFYGGSETDKLVAAITAEAANGNTRLILNMAECSFASSPVL